MKIEIETPKEFYDIYCLKSKFRYFLGAKNDIIFNDNSMTIITNEDESEVRRKVEQALKYKEKFISLVSLQELSQDLGFNFQWLTNSIQIILSKIQTTGIVAEIEKDIIFLKIEDEEDFKVLMISFENELLNKIKEIYLLGGIPAKILNVDFIQKNKLILNGDFYYPNWINKKIANDRVDFLMKQLL